MSLSTLLDRAQSINQATTFKKAVRAFEKAIEPFGARYYALGPMAPVKGEEVFAVAESPNDFAKIYAAEALFENDPLRRASRAGLTFEWADVKPLNAAEARTLEMVRGAGMRNGFATVKSGPGALKLGVTMAWSEGDSRSPEDRLQAQILCVAMLSHVLYLNELSWRQALPLLTPFDIQILTIASNAHVDKEIARILDVRPEAVHERWRTIRGKLGAKDRAHACTIAASIGLIPPPERAMDLVFGKFIETSANDE